MTIGGAPLENRLPGRQGRALFAYLTVHRERAVTRDELIDVLWPHDPPASPEAGLSTLLTRLRRSLGEGVVEGRHELSLVLPGDAWIDLEAAHAADGRAATALAAEDPQAALDAARQALAIVERPLLPEFDAHWVESLRQELEDLRLSLLESAARAALELGDGQTATAHASALALIRAAPYRESGYALLMRAHAARGDVAEALRVYDDLRTRLREEFGTVPSARLIALYEELLHEPEQQGTAAPAPVAAGAIPLPPPLARSQSRPFVGRGAALAGLRSAWEAGDGGPSLVLVTGEPGIGKTFLAGRFAAELGDAATVLYGRSDEDAPASFQPLAEVLTHYLANRDLDVLGRDLAAELRELGRLVPWLGLRLGEAPASLEPSDGGQRFRMFEAATAVLRHASRERPLLVVLDDAQWADQPTLLLLRHLLRGLAGEPAMFLLTFREADVHADHPLADLVADVRREQPIERLGLDGLDETETAELIGGLRGESDAELARDLRERTGGNPLFVEEVLRNMAELEQMPQGVARPGVPEGVKGIILRRLRRLGPEATELMSTASVIGPRFGLQILETVLGRSADVLLDTVEELVEAGLLAEVPGRVDEFAFAHALVRETFYERLIESRRVRLHQRVGRALEGHSRAVPAAELAHHFQIGRAVAGPADAVRYSLLAAAHASQALAYEEAAFHYGCALEALESAEERDPGRECDVLLALGAVQWQAGERAARSTFVRAAESARGRGAVEQLGRAALGVRGPHTPAGIVDHELIALLEEALAAAGSEHPSLRAELLARLGDALLFADGPRAAELTGEAVEVARDAGDPDALLTALGARHGALLSPDHLAERLRVGGERIELARRAGRPDALAAATRWQVYDLYESGDVDAARREAAGLAALAEELQQPLYRHFSANWAAVDAQLRGDFELAESLIEESAALGRRGQARDADMNRIVALLMVRREQGRAGELEASIRGYADHFPGVPAWQVLAALVAMATGDQVSARAEVERQCAGGCERLPRDPFFLPALAGLAEIAAATDAGAEAGAALHELLAAYADHWVTMGLAASWGSVERFLGLAALAAGDPAAAEQHLDRAAERHRAAGAGPLLARTLVNRSEAILRSGDPARRPEAEHALAEAAAIAESLGMPALLGEAVTARA